MCVVKDFVGDKKACFVFGITVVLRSPFPQIGPDFNMSIMYSIYVYCIYTMSYNLPINVNHELYRILQY